MKNKITEQEKNFEWYSENLCKFQSKYIGKVIAIENQSISEIGNNYKEVFEKTKNQEALIVRVPDDKARIIHIKHPRLLK